MLRTVSKILQVIAVMLATSQAAQAASVTYNFSGMFGVPDGNSVQQTFVDNAFGSGPIPLVDMSLTLPETLSLTGAGFVDGSMSLDWGGFNYQSPAPSIFFAQASASPGNSVLYFSAPDSAGPVVQLTVRSSVPLTTIALFSDHVAKNPESVGYVLDLSGQTDINGVEGVKGLDGTFSSVGGVSEVPLPAAAWLFLSGLAGMAGVKRLGTRRAV